MILAKLIKNKSRILKNLRDRKADLELYNYLQSSLQCANVATNEQYQGKFLRFYGVRRDKDWRKTFFSILEREKKNRAVSFDKVLEELYHSARHNGKQQVETSYASKLVATIRPELPVFDKYVKENLGLKTSYIKDSEKRLTSSINVYSRLHQQTLAIIQSQSFIELRTSFDAALPKYKHLTDIKKLDLFLWQYR